MVNPVNSPGAQSQKPNFSYPKRMALACVEELEREYSRIAVERCNRLKDPTQLSAFVLLGLRAVSLLREMFSVLRPDSVDAYKAIRQAFLETWQLQYEFKFVASAAKVPRFFEENKETWNSAKQSLERSMQNDAEAGETPGRKCEDASQAMPANFNVVVDSAGIDRSRGVLQVETEFFDGTVKDLADDFAELLDRQTWLTVIRNKSMMDTCTGSTSLAASLNFHRGYQDSSSLEEAPERN